MRLTLGLLLVLVGCATPPTVRGTPWQLHSGAVDVDFEEPPPQQAEHLRQRGIQLPRGSHGLADLRAHRDFVERRVAAVGFGLSAGGYLLYCEGVALPVLVPEAQVDMRLTGAAAMNTSLSPDQATDLNNAYLGWRGSLSGGAVASMGQPGRFTNPSANKWWCNPLITKGLRHGNQQAVREVRHTQRGAQA